MKKTYLLFILIVGFTSNLFADNNIKVKRIFEGKEDAKIVLLI